MASAQFRQPVIGHARVVGRFIRRGKQLKWGICERQDLSIVTELVEKSQPRLEIPQRADTWKCGRRRKVGCQLFQPVEIGRWHEMIEYVDNHDCVLEGDGNL